MRRSRVAKRYAQALFEAAQESKKLESVEADMRQLNHACESSAEFRDLMDSPVVPSATKGKILSDLFDKRLNELSHRFLKLLLEKGREDVLLQITEEFSELLDNDRGIVRGDVHSVVPLSPQQMTILVAHLSKITGKKVNLSQHTNKSLLGGLVVNIEDTVYDMSIRNQLNRLRQSLIES